jgi:hypothetical protein
LSSTGVLSPPLIPIFRDHFKTFHILSQIRHDTALKAHIMKKKKQDGQNSLLQK